MGRPKLDRELGYRLLADEKSTPYIRRALHCSARSVRMLRKEMRDKNIVSKAQVDYSKLDQASRNLEDEILEVMGTSFLEWLKRHRVAATRYFNKAKEAWEFWGKPNIYILKDQNEKLGDQLLEKYVAQFCSDPVNSRTAKSLIRPLLIFLGRKDLCDRYLTVTESRDPRNMREVSEVTFTDFPLLLEKAIALLRERMGEKAELLIKLKIITMLRTGSEKANKELFGIKVKETNHTYLIMKSQDEWDFRILAKRNEKWVISWIPSEIRALLFKHYQATEKGAYLFGDIDVNVLRKTWGDCCLRAGLPELILHDMRKIGITWLYTLGIPLEVATDINVGWRDLNTAKRFYVQFRKVIKREQRDAYRANIPKWFNEGLEEFFDEVRK